MFTCYLWTKRGGANEIGLLNKRSLSFSCSLAPVCFIFSCIILYHKPIMVEAAWPHKRSLNDASLDAEWSACSVDAKCILYSIVRS